jgi:hypothetical protein
MIFVFFGLEGEIEIANQMWLVVIYSNVDKAMMFLACLISYSNGEEYTRETIILSFNLISHLPHPKRSATLLDPHIKQ